MVPALERRIVFGGLDALFTFHKDNFLPALELAAAPMMVPSATLETTDADGMQSIHAVKAVANTFLRHTAFMKMYSTYIKYVYLSKPIISYADSLLTVTLTTHSTVSRHGQPKLRLVAARSRQVQVLHNWSGSDSVWALSQTL